MQFFVPDMSCGHCTAAIEAALREHDSAADISFVLEDHKVTVATKLTVQDVLSALNGAGYPAELYT